MLMLDAKGVPYRVRQYVTAMHPVLARLHGFDTGGQRRTVDGARPFFVRFAEVFGTVPGLAAGRERVSTNHAIARWLDARPPEPRLVPGDPRVVEAERWANEVLQMAARRILGGLAAHDPGGMSRAGADGRMGYLLYANRHVRRLMIPLITRRVFHADRAGDERRVAELPALLDRVDAYIADGVICGEQPNVADCMIAPSLALMLYREELGPVFAGRPALELVDRLLPA